MHFLNKELKNRSISVCNFSINCKEPDKNCTFNGKCFICEVKGDKKMEYPRKSKQQANVVEKEEKEEEDNIIFITEVKRNNDSNNNDKDYRVLNIQEKNI